MKNKTGQTYSFRTLHILTKPFYNKPIFFILCTIGYQSTRMKDKSATTTSDVVT